MQLDFTEDNSAFKWYCVLVVSKLARDSGLGRGRQRAFVASGVAGAKVIAYYQAGRTLVCQPSGVK